MGDSSEVAMPGREYDDYLSNKRPNLSAPGSRLSDLYYSDGNSSVEVLESTCDWSNRISLTSKTFGSSNQVNLPMSAFVGQVILHLQAPAILLTNQSLARGWGLAMIRQIRFQIGTSASSPILLTKQAIWHFLMAQCHTSEKRSELFKLCGEEYLRPPLAPVDGAVPTIDAFIPIPLPFSTVCEKLMYDTTILGQPITLFIDFEQNPRVAYGGSAAPPASFDIAELLIRQQRLYDPSKGLRNIMRQYPAYMYTYPWIMALGYQTNGTFEGVARGQGTRCSVQFNQFQNSDLLGIIMCVQRVTDLTPESNSTPNPFVVDDIEDVEMTYNGATIFQLPGKSYRAISTYLGDQQAQYYEGSVVLQGSISPFISVPQNQYLVYFDFAQQRSACSQSHMYNTWRIPPGNVLNVSFFTSQGGPTHKYQCFYTCLYNSILTAQDGVSNIFTA